MELLALHLTARDGLETVFSQPPIEPAPFTDKDEAPVRLQYPCDLGWMQSAAPLRDKVEEAIGVGEVFGLAMLEGDAPLRVKAHGRYRLLDLIGGCADSAYAGGGELAGEEKHAVAFAAFDLENPFRPRGNVQHGGSQRDKRGRRHRPII